MHYFEGLLLLLTRLWRAVLLVSLLVVFLMVWLAARRAGRRGLEIAIPMWALAGTLFFVAVFAPRPPFTEAVAISLVLISAVLVLGSLVALFLAARRPRAAKPSRPPWEGGGP